MNEDNYAAQTGRLWLPGAVAGRFDRLSFASLEKLGVFGYLIDLMNQIVKSYLMSASDSRGMGGAVHLAGSRATITGLVALFKRNPSNPRTNLPTAHV